MRIRRIDRIDGLNSDTNCQTGNLDIPNLDSSGYGTCRVGVYGGIADTSTAFYRNKCADDGMGAHEQRGFTLVLASKCIDGMIASRRSL